MSSISFRYQERNQPHAHAKALAASLLEPYPPQMLRSRGALNREWDESAVRELLEVLQPEWGRLFLVARDHDPVIVGDQGAWETEKWYGTEYQVKRLDAELVEKVSHVLLLLNE